MICMDCARKHLAAALAYAGEGRDREVPKVTGEGSACGYVSQAYVLATEACAYPEHLDMAVGMLVRAEELYVAEGLDDRAAATRGLRLGSSGSPQALASALWAHPDCDPFVGHAREAARESGARLPDTMSKDWFMTHYGEVKAGVLGAGLPGTDAPGAGKEVSGDGMREEGGLQGRQVRRRQGGQG